MSDHDADVAVAAEGVSKFYEGLREQLYQPIVSIFHRGPFSRDPAGSARGSRRAEREPDLEDEEEDDEDDEVEDEGLDGLGRVEPFWALKNVSLEVPAGEGLGILGGPGAGKSTLLRILAGCSPPTEGRVLIREPFLPPPAELAKSLAFTGRASFPFNLVLGCRMQGISGRLVRQHQDEITELARPERGPDGKLDAGTMNRFAVAAAVVLPGSVILLEQMRGMDEAFMRQVRRRLRERMDAGTALVMAARDPEQLRKLCDEVLLLESGEIVDRGRPKSVLRRVQGPPARRATGGRPVEIPPTVPAFNATAALLSTRLYTASGNTRRIDAAEDEVIVEIDFATALPDVEADVAVVFMNRTEEPGVRLAPPEPLRFSRPGTYRLVVRVQPGTLWSGAYVVRADAVVAQAGAETATAIARRVERVRVHGDEVEALEGGDAPLTHWNGRVVRPAEAEWSVE